MSVRRMDNVSIVVEDLAAAIDFFAELGLELEGQQPVEGEWVDRIVGLKDVKVDIAMMRTPDGHSRLELTRFRSPALAARQPLPPNALGFSRVMFAVDDLDDTVARLERRGGALVGEIVNYEDVYRLCYLRGPAGFILGIAQQLR